MLAGLCPAGFNEVSLFILLQGTVELDREILLVFLYGIDIVDIYALVDQQASELVQDLALQGIFCIDGGLDATQQHAAGLDGAG